MQNVYTVDDHIRMYKQVHSPRQISKNNAQKLATVVQFTLWVICGHSILLIFLYKASNIGSEATASVGCNGSVDSSNLLDSDRTET